ncbi:hypothetical protein B296_00016201 [Ensete ventricosum]|uniref:BHLH domain-containing protein n=1 Tax=Ensete ventricosum TaxID=4639 RepID=A0A426ZAL7_ENSVE|nr:hypothetical protein B296_00016201 [Ensete ventricosum]
MAEDFHTGICSGGSWWNPKRTASFDAQASTCSTAAAEIGGRAFSWASFGEPAGSAGGSSMISQETHEVQHPDVCPSLIVDSTMPSFSLSSSSMSWTKSLLYISPGGVQDSCSSSTKKTGSEPAVKKLRIETPSPLPTFKVRKEKLGDRITALQQLVSPFGKNCSWTNNPSALTKSVIELQVLSSPYLKDGHPMQHQVLNYISNKSKDCDETKQDLRSRGLCLVPITSTYLVASETTADFWHPTFGVSRLGERLHGFAGSHSPATRFISEISQHKDSRFPSAVRSSVPVELSRDARLSATHPLNSELLRACMHYYWQRSRSGASPEARELKRPKDVRNIFLAIESYCFSCVKLSE